MVKLNLKMKVYVFGNQDLPQDNLAFQVADKLQNKIKGVEFTTVKLNEDLPFTDEKQVVILDTVEGIKKVEIIDENDLDKLTLSPKTSVHDFDLGFQLKYLKKLDKLQKVTIIGLPPKGEINYFLIQSILRKLVAQDMQGS